MIQLHEQNVPRKPTPAEVLLRSGHPREAHHYLKMEKDTKSFMWWSNLGACLRMLGKLDPAKEACKKAIELNPIAEKAWFNLALIMEDFGEFEKAREAIDAAYSILPVHKDIAWRYARMNMRFGDWSKYRDAWDFSREEISWVPLAGIPRWYGEPLAGKRVIVLHEGGYGDFFWLYRYFRLLKEMGCHVTFNAWEKQKEFCKKFCPWIDHVVSGGDFIDERRYDFQIPLWSLMALNDGPMESGPYFEVKETLLGHVGLVVGLCWEATEPGVVRKFRSIPICELQQLSRLPVQWAALGLADKVPDWCSPKLSVGGWENVPSAIAQCDLVVSVDTGIAHLAGAMWKETILLLPKNSSWQWGTPDNSFVSSWYPQMTSVRNPNPLKWDAVIDEVCQIIKAKVAQRVA